MSKQKEYDYIVIGSGFGGSVSALRLAEKGYRVAVLEKGKRYRTEDFPKTNWNLRKYLWMPKLGLYGIQMMTLFRHVLVLHGGGVGGGSLVYANQLRVPTDKAFEHPAWGSGNWKEKLAPFYSCAQKMLGANPSPTIGRADECLREVGEEYCGKDTFHQSDVGVYFGEPDKTVADPLLDGKGPDRTGCTFCGACMIGCPVGAKNTLDKNYLYLAEKLGVEIIPETEVVDVRPQAEGYEVVTRKSTGILPRRRKFSAKGVIFSAGVIGTNRLLMQCRDRGSLPKLSDQLGNYIRTNSEAILAVNSRDKKTDWNDQIAITSGIYPDEHTHIEMVRYNKGSDVLFGLVSVFTDGGGLIPRQLRFVGNVLRNPLSFLQGLWLPGKAKTTSAVLVMQTSENYLRFNYKPRWYRLGGKSLNSDVPTGEKRVASYIPVANEITRRLAKKMNGVPKSMLSEVLLNAPTTAHILGGCSMADTIDQGVVGFNGEVFGYKNLYVSDGSVIPANLGVNPSLTITALAEYIMSQVPSPKT